jgi:probable rRNA maturation factor
MVILQKRVPGLTEDTLDRFVTRAKRSTGLRGSVTVLVTTSRELRRLNQRFRGKDTPTDVLSFPPAYLAAKGFAGDVAISADIAAQNARRLGHSPAEEIKILALHGVLHLAGYDHETDNGTMARREELLRKQLGLPVGLIERNSTSKTLNRGVRRERPRSSRRDVSFSSPSRRRGQ